MEKYNALQEIFVTMKSVLVAYSGGVDSTLLLKVAQDVLGDKVLAVTAQSSVYPAEEIERAKALAENLGARHKIIETRELSNPKFITNPEDRCYWCKRELFATLTRIAQENGLRYVSDGTNSDDVDDFRPGMRAAYELGVRSPLKEAGLTKEDIRSLSKRLGLSTWDKPSLACLASRFPYGSSITQENLAMVDAAEIFLREHGLSQVRVRHYGATARIEVPKDDIHRMVEEGVRAKILSYFKELGYSYITLDLEGYRTGSMNEVLRGDKRQG